MIKTLCDSGDLAPADRLAYFDECQVRSEQPMRVISEPVGFRATVRALDLAAVNVVELTCSDADLRRTPKLVRQTDPELYAIVVPLRGSVALAQGERTAELGAGEMGLYTSSDPLHVRLTGEPGSATTLLRAHLPRTLLPLPPRKVDRLAGTRVSGRSGVGAMFAGFLTRLAADAAAYTQADVSRMGTVAVDLLTAALAHHLDAEPPATARAAVLLPRITGYIQRRLGDPGLSPATIAAAHHISVSYLHRLFQAHDMSPAAWIRRQRIARARRDLADPALHDVPVHRIATRWGFTDHATFTRAFHAANGIPPRDYRRRALGERPA